jgi:protein-S-isoprenylcysteine O-methyltransferase Ste14
VEVVLIVGPRHELITTGPYAVLKHLLYTAVALLVLLPGSAFWSARGWGR